MQVSPFPNAVELSPLPPSGKHVMNPMSPLAASATVVNLVLATGPFTYPYGFSQLGPILSIAVMIPTCIVAYITATFMIEAISISNAKRSRIRQGSLFSNENYKTPIIQRRQNEVDS